MESSTPVTLDVDELFADFEDAPAENAIDNVRDSSPPRHVEKIHRSDKILALKAENRRLRNEVRLLKKIGSSACSVKYGTGPVAQVCFFNRKLSLEHRRRIEDGIVQLANDWKTPNLGAERRAAAENNTTTHWSTATQPSAINLLSESVDLVDDSDLEEGDDDIMVTGVSSASASVSTAGLAITGSIQVHNGFMLDTVGAPLFGGGNVLASASFEPPVFRRGFPHMLPASQEEITAKARKGNLCFNCCQPGHALSDCKAPRDEMTIQSNRQQFATLRTPQRTPVAARYHADRDNITDGQISKFRPGVISSELREALGLKEGDIPLHVYRMRVFGYPPAYGIEDERQRFSGDKIKCTLSLYSGDGEGEDDAMEIDAPDGSSKPGTGIEYTATSSKMSVRYPGFNCAAPPGTQDKWRELGFPPYDVAKGDTAEEKTESGSRIDQSSPVPVIEVRESEAEDAPCTASRQSAKFSRGDAKGKADADGSNSNDETEDGEILSRTTSPVIAVANEPKHITASGSSAAAAIEIQDEVPQPVAPTGKEEATAAMQPEEGEGHGTGEDTEEVQLLDLSAGSPSAMDEPDTMEESAGDAAPAVSPKRQWSTDFPPDMAPAEGELRHRWLSLRKLVDEHRSQDV